MYTSKALLPVCRGMAKQKMHSSTAAVLVRFTHDGKVSLPCSVSYMNIPTPKPLHVEINFVKITVKELWVNISGISYNDYYNADQRIPLIDVCMRAIPPSSKKNPYPSLLHTSGGKYMIRVLCWTTWPTTLYFYLYDF